MVNYDKIFSSESENINPEHSQEGLGIAFIMITSIALIGEIITKIQEVHKKSVLKKNKKTNPDYNAIAHDIKDFLQCISDNVVKTANVIKNNYDILLNNYCSNKDKLLKKVESVALDYFNNLDSIIVFSDINDNYNYKHDDGRVEQMSSDGALYDEFYKSINNDKRLKRVQNKDIWKFFGKKIEFEFYLNDYSFVDKQIGLHISLNEVDKSMSSESEDKDEEGTEVGVYACSQGVFDTNSKPFEIGGYQIDATKTDSSEQSEEAISDFLFQHGKKIHSDEELIKILNKLKEKHKNNLVKNYSEFKKLGGISGLNLMGILKSIGPNGAEFREMENILLFETRPNGSFVWRNIFCFIKTGNDRKKGKTMKCVSVACMMPSKK